MSNIALNTLPTFESFANICTIFGLDSKIDKDALYDELTETKSVFESIVAHGSAISRTSQKWQQYFKLCQTNFAAPRNVFRIVCAALSVPGNNAFCERIFSLMNAKWRAERNRASVALVRSELQIYVNFGMTCNAFYSYVLSDTKLLNAAASGQKYY